MLSNIHLGDVRFNYLNFFFIKIIKDTGKERAKRIAEHKFFLDLISFEPLTQLIDVHSW